MKVHHAILALVAALTVFSAPQAYADAPMTSALSPDAEELDPFAPNVEQTLKDFDAAYEAQTGLMSHIGSELRTDALTGCYRQTCHIWVIADKGEQALHLYIDGNPAGDWLISSGMSGHETPDFDRHPDGRIYDSYTSTKFPEGDYMGLGNMPYAVFIEGGFALHGTPRGNWPRLGRPASHGCIRQHPDNARYFNRLVRASGVHNVWITVQ